MASLPDLLTIEEAAQVIRVGRTKAYAMAREWRATGGKSGLPVIDFGHAVRVPLCQLETIVGGPLTGQDLSGEPPAATTESETLQASSRPAPGVTTAPRSSTPVHRSEVTPARGDPFRSGRVGFDLTAQR